MPEKKHIPELRVPILLIPIRIRREFENQFLIAHNLFRQLHRVPPLDISPGLSRIAQRWANHLATNNDLAYSSNTTFGELIYKTDENEIDVGKIMFKWYSEIAKYDFLKSEFNVAAGHFTQIVWRATKQLGVGMAKRGATTFIVLNYFPPGNIIGEFRINVLPARRLPSLAQTKATLDVNDANMTGIWPAQFQNPTEFEKSFED